MTLEELHEAGFVLAAPAHARLERFVAALLEENQRVNLTALRTAEAVWRKHVCDSLMLLALFEADQPRAVLDLGTGGGVPGLPLACVLPEVRFTLLDATRKKIEAVRRIAAAIPVENVACVAGRAEELAHDARYREQFDAVTVRAVAEVRVLVEYATGFVRTGGVCWFFKTPGSAEAEARTAEKAAATCGLSLEGHRLGNSLGCETRSCPGESDCERATSMIVCYRKSGLTPAHLPRPPGRARKRPL